MVKLMREKRDIRSVILNFGVALSLSLGGFLYSFLRTKRIKSTQSPPSLPPSDCGNEVDLAATKTPCSFEIASVEPNKEESCLSRIINENYDGDKDGYLLLDFQEFVKEFDLATAKASNSPTKDVETPKSDIDTPIASTCTKNDYYEQEIKSLRNTVRILKERERTLEIQLLEYYGLKEEEAAVMELRNRLRINSMEAKLFTLKIGSLQEDNRRLEAQVADYARVVAELEEARAKIKLLEKKFRCEAEQNTHEILTLQQRVSKLQNLELEDVTNDVDIQLKMQKLKYLEEEAEDLRKSNYSLRNENYDLAQRLESTEVLATSILDDQEVLQVDALKEERDSLRRENEVLAKEIEQLKADRCGDAEELVYLRWVNVCLRYELRNYQPGANKNIARDLSKTSSPESEDKAKQLILKYASRESWGYKGINVIDFDSEWWSSPQTSYFTDSSNFDDSSVDNSTANRTNTSSKRKIFGKLRRLIPGKDNYTYDINDLEGPWRKSNVGYSGVHKNIVSSKSPQENEVYEDSERVERSELLKYAEVLKDSHGTSLKLCRRSASYSSF